MSQARVLAVDDQLYFRVFLEDLLAQEGYAVETAGSGTEALEMLEDRSFDLVLTDLVMPAMDGRALVGAVKERWPDQEIVVITSVGDVKTAVDAMKLGATDYLLKPIDRTALLRAIESILDRRAMRAEHERLVAENLSYMGHFAQYERALGLFATLSVEPLADRLVEVMCLETNAHGGVAWLARRAEADTLHLTGAGGLVRVDDEPAELVPAQLPDALASMVEPRTRSFLVPGPEGRQQLYVPLRHNGALLGVVRLSDRLDGGEFDAADREVVERFGLFAAQAVSNALAFRALEKSSFKDPTTRAYTKAYATNAIGHELSKAKRFGRPLSVVRVRLDPIAPLRETLTPERFTTFLQQVVGSLHEALRNTDLLASEGEHQYLMLLPECDSLGAVVAKRRIRACVEQCAALQAIDALERPAVLSAMATFPSNGSDLAALELCLDRRIEEDRTSLLRADQLETTPFRGLVETLLADAAPGRARIGEQMTRTLLAEVARNPHHRGLLFLAPREGRTAELRDGLVELRGLNPRTEVVIVADRDDQLLPGVPVTWVSPLRVGAEQPFVVYMGEGASYALVEDAASEPEPSTYHTADPVVVEQLAFQLGRDLGVPIGE